MKKSEVWLQIVLAKSSAATNLTEQSIAGFADNMCNKFEERFGDFEKESNVKYQPVEKDFG